MDGWMDGWMDREQFEIAGRMSKECCKPQGGRANGKAISTQRNDFTQEQ